jgi:hypothetical protein
VYIWTRKSGITESKKEASFLLINDNLDGIENRGRECISVE